MKMTAVCGECIAILLANSALVTVELLSWLSSVCPSVCYGCTVAKRCKIRPRLLLIINRKSHIGFQIKQKSSTLNDLEGH